MKTYKELTVWQKSVECVVSIYRMTERFPDTERYGLVSQMRRAAVSVPSNIAEGYPRKHRQEYIQFLRIAFGSGAELETQMILAHKLSFITQGEYDTLEESLTEVMKMLHVLIATLVAKP